MQPLPGDPETCRRDKNQRTGMGGGGAVVRQQRRDTCIWSGNGALDCRSSAPHRTSFESPFPGAKANIMGWSAGGGAGVTLSGTRFCGPLHQMCETETAHATAMRLSTPSSGGHLGHVRAAGRSSSHIRRACGLSGPWTGGGGGGSNTPSLPHGHIIDGTAGRVAVWTIRPQSQGHSYTLNIWTPVSTPLQRLDSGAPIPLL